MTTSAANALHARRHARTLRRTSGRSVAVLGFAALTWAALTGSAMALGGGDQPADQTSAQSSTQSSAGAAPVTAAKQPGIPLGAAVGSIADGAVRGLSSAAGTVTQDSVKPAPVEHTGQVQAQPSRAVEQAETAAPARLAPPAQSTQTTSQSAQTTQTTSAPSEPAQTGAAGAAGIVGSTVHRLTTYTVPQAATKLLGGDQAHDDRPAPAKAAATGLSVSALAGGVDAAVSDLGNTVLAATNLDQTVSAPHVNLLSNTLQTLGVSDALPAVPLPALPVDTSAVTSLPVVGTPVDDVLGSLPVGTSQTGQMSPTGPTDSDTVTTLPVPGAGAGVLLPAGSAAADQNGPTTTGALPVLPVLLPFEAYPDLGSTASPATFASLADGGADGDGHSGTRLSDSLLQTSGGAAGDRSIPLPNDPQSPAGGHGGSSGSGDQQGGQVTSFALPGGNLVTLVREYVWHLPATPTSDPGFSPD